MATSYRSISPISSLNGFGPAVTALSFDTVSDILWAGLNAGTVTAYLGPRGVRGPSFHVGGDLGVKKIAPGDNYVRALGNSNEGLGSWTKGGMNKWFFRPTSGNVVAFSNTLPSSNYLVASLDNLEMVLLSPVTGTAMRKIPTASVLTHLELCHSMLISGSADGYLRIHDPRTGMARGGGAENSAKAHARSIRGLETAGNLIFTIGMGERQSRPFPDPLVKIYDQRTMRPLPPIPFSAGPAFIHALPNRTSSITIISSQGLINIVDASNISASNEFYQLDITTYITSTSISASATYMAFGDADGTIHLMSQAIGDTPFNGFEGQPVPWADTPSPLPDIEWTQSTPLNSVGMPFFDTTLLSTWPSNLSSKASRLSPPPGIPPQVLSSMKFNENIAYASLPKELRGRRNMMNALPRKGAGRFRSGRATVAEGELDIVFFGHDDDEVPRIYRRVEIEYSKFGIEDFDFGFYNKTNFSGLETHILNSYTNSIVQVMHYIKPIRTLAKAHITINCPREHCLLCEMGFVFRMLEDARGTNCQASNFCKTVGVLAQASNAIELIDYGREGPEVDYGQKIQTFHRFLIDHMNSESDIQNTPSLSPSNVPSPNKSSSPITELLGLMGRNIIVCSNCKEIREKQKLTHIIDLVYPKRDSSSEALIPTFSHVLRNSIFRQITHKATCQRCRQFSTFVSQWSSLSRQLPPILAVNASVYDDESLSFWQDHRGSTFLQPRISISLSGQGAGDDDTEVVYNIRALIIKVSGKDRKSHLATIVKVPEDEEHGTSSPWFLFNDFVVANISEAEALSFQKNWKVPAIIYFERSDLRSAVDLSATSNQLDPSILSKDTSISLNRDANLIKHEFLRPDEFPKPGTLVAIDAEFVSMQQEETEFRSDGTKKVLRPARLSLARVSVLRGSGPRAGVPFIDDHIHTSEMIVDYLTEFSGIKFGDLDPVLSKYTLTPLKLVYKKLRLLVDSGCIFVGHGLSKDFRIINIYVPPEQVIDTVDLYFLKSRQRRLSLRFLSWYILGEHIQKDTHDSIEDARSALRLYEAFQEFEEQGIFDQKLDEVYREGRQFNFKPPIFPGSTGEGVQTPSPNPPFHSLVQNTSLDQRLG